MLKAASFLCRHHSDASARIFLDLLFVLTVIALFIVSACPATSAAAPITQLVNITFGHPTGGSNGTIIDLRRDKTSASGFRSKEQFLFARVGIQMKLVPSDSAGTVTTFYMSSTNTFHDEIDFDFLGNQPGYPYILHTNIYANGPGNKEMQLFLWFDPRTYFRTYTICGTQDSYCEFYIDGQQIRAFANLMKLGIPFPTSQAMRVYCSLWDAWWATPAKNITWAHAPFVASYTNLVTRPCPNTSSKDPLCKIPPATNGNVKRLDPATKQTILALQKKYMFYNYCTDAKRFPLGFPPECSVSF